MRLGASLHFKMAIEGSAFEEGADRERGITMAEAEFWKQKDDADSDLGDQIHGVRLEVERLRTGYDRSGWWCASGG